MVKILVCFKVVRDLEQVIEEDWNVEKGASLHIDYTKKIWNCFDEAALETALRIKESLGGECQCSAVTAADGSMEIGGFVRGLYGVGYDNVAVISGGGDPAESIAQYAGQKGFDAILTGMQASPCDSGKTGAMLAEYLTLPFINRVYHLEPGEKGLIAETPIEGGMRRMEILSPAVYAFGNAKYSYLRSATLREKMKASAKTPELIQEDGTKGQAFPLLAYEQAREKRQADMIGESDPEAAARVLYYQYLKEVLK